MLFLPFSHRERKDKASLSLLRGAVTCLARHWGVLPLLWEGVSLSGVGSNGMGQK